MRTSISSILVILFGLFFVSCGGSNQPPLDSKGHSPEDVLLSTYKQILKGDYSSAQESFSQAFIEEFVTTKNITFEEYCNPTEGWQEEWLKTKLMGNDYNDDIWRVKIIPDEGKGKHNGPGIVQDLRMTDGEWKIVFWGHYPKS